MGLADYTCDDYSTRICTPETNPCRKKYVGIRKPSTRTREMLTHGSDSDESSFCSTSQMLRRCYAKQSYSPMTAVFAPPLDVSSQRTDTRFSRRLHFKKH